MWAAALACACRATPCWGHGTPIVVHVAGNQLQVSNGVADAVGYSNWVFADEDPEAWLVPGPNSIQLTTLPGFDVNDMQVGEELSLEILSRPDFSRPGRPQRWLWHWNAAADDVTIAANDPMLELVSVRGFVPSVPLVQQTAPIPTTLKLANILDTDLGEHRHTVLYKLDDSPPADIGVYGFFARLKSPAYQPSEPFLIALNSGLDDAILYQQGALEINAAAGLAGDLNVDGVVDGADFLLWQRTLGSTAPAGSFPPADASLDGSVNAPDLAIWREEFGRTVQYPRPAAEGAVASVPEPSAIAIAALACIWLSIAPGARRGFSRRKPWPRGQGY
jgi:hypothetical protein